MTADVAVHSSEEVLSIPCYAIRLQDMEQTRGREAEAGFEQETGCFHLLSFSEWEIAGMGKASPIVALAKLLLVWLCLGFPIHKPGGGNHRDRRSLICSGSFHADPGDQTGTRGLLTPHVPMCTS